MKLWMITTLLITPDNCWRAVSWIGPARTEDDAFSDSVKLAAKMGVDWAVIVSQDAEEIPAVQLREWEECCR